MVAKTTVTSLGGFGKALEGISERLQEAEANPKQLKIDCPHCGNGSFRFDSEKGDDGHLWCEKCGVDLGTRREVIEAAAARELRKIIDG